MAVLVATLTAGASAPATVEPPATFGDLGGIAMGGPWTWLPGAEQARDLDQVAATGARWIRVSFPWSSLQFERHRYDWSTHDRIVRLAGERGLRVIANVAYSPAWARRGCGVIHCPPASPQAFADFVGRAVARYSAHGVVAWEIWNEPNISRFWRSGPDPEAYADLLVRSYAAAKAADPSVSVVTGGLAPRARDTAHGLTPLTFLTRLYDALDGTEAFDAVGIHPYTFPRPPLAAHPTNTFTQLPLLHDLMAVHGDGDKRLWVTEFGFWTSPRGDRRGGAVTPALQARYLREAYRAAGRRDWVGPFLWFSYRDRGGVPALADPRPEDNFGLRRDDGRPKPASRVFAELMRSPLP